MLSKKCISNREGLILYWCEGDKPSGVNYTVAVTSSDYRIVSLFLGWLKKYYNIPDERIKLRLHLWPDSDEKAAKEHWAEKLGLPMSSFTKSYIKDKSGKNNKYKNGICRASIHGTKILSDILKRIEKEFC